ncbi:PepSY-associated TM helix domain-containing protein [Stenotrophomonas sp. TWI587]|uniref:PepSY-associated TM helix domain-containing protein n=1 Tax=Stenotrophomonas sp. TWI587 TaxID=3136783 RepID=UPI0032093EB0
MRLHRWFGLAGAAFLLVVGLTGGVLAFYEELDAWMAPQLVAAERLGQPRLDLAVLAEHAQALAPEVLVVEATWRHDGRQAEIRTQPRAGTNASSDPEFDSILLDPWTGAELGRRTWGDIRQGTINLIPYIYRLHYELALGHPGMLLLGLVALGWTLDCFIGLVLTLPMPTQHAGSRRPTKRFWSRWAPAWKIKHPASGTRRLFDLHRAFSLWCWAVLLVFAWSGVSFNLPSVYEPVMRVLTGYVQSKAVATQPETSPSLSWPQALHRARSAMDQASADQGLTVQREVMLRLLPEQGLWLYRTHTSRDILDRRGASDLYMDAATGQALDFRLPTGQDTGTTITHWLYALHVANVGGWPWRVTVVLIGLVLTLLSVTGVLIWQRKRRVKLPAVKS